MGEPNLDGATASIASVPSKAHSKAYPVRHSFLLQPPLHSQHRALCNPRGITRNIGHHTVESSHSCKNSWNVVNGKEGKTENPVAFPVGGSAKYCRMPQHTIGAATPPCCRGHYGRREQQSGVSSCLLEWLRWWGGREATITHWGILQNTDFAPLLGMLLLSLVFLFSAVNLQTIVKDLIPRCSAKWNISKGLVHKLLFSYL